MSGENERVVDLPVEDVRDHIDMIQSNAIPVDSVLEQRLQTEVPLANSIDEQGLIRKQQIRMVLRERKTKAKTRWDALLQQPPPRVRGKPKKMGRHRVKQVQESQEEYVYSIPRVEEKQVVEQPLVLLPKIQIPIEVPQKPQLEESLSKSSLRIVFKALAQLNKSAQVNILGFSHEQVRTRISSKLISDETLLESLNELDLHGKIHYDRLCQKIYI